jgi:hypothetical protein
MELDSDLVLERVDIAEHSALIVIVVTAKTVIQFPVMLGLRCGVTQQLSTNFATVSVSCLHNGTSVRSIFVICVATMLLRWVNTVFFQHNR